MANLNTVMEDLKTTDTVRDMLAARERLRASMTEFEWGWIMTLKQTDLRIVMANHSCTAIEAADIVVDLLEVNLALEDDVRELHKAVYILAAVELMGPEFIASLTE